jgi:hypothetical protein
MNAVYTLYCLTLTDGTTFCEDPTLRVETCQFRIFQELDRRNRVAPAPRTPLVPLTAPPSSDCADEAK